MHNGCIKGCTAGAEWLHYRMQSGCITGCTKQMQNGCIKGCTKQVHSVCIKEMQQMQSGCITGCSMFASKDAHSRCTVHYRMWGGCMKGYTAGTEWLQ